MGYNGNNRRLRSSMFKKSHTKKGSKIISSLISAPFSVISDTTPRRRKTNRDIYECNDEDIKFFKSHKRQIIVAFMVFFVLGIIIFGFEFILYLLMFALFAFLAILNNS